MHNEMIEKLAQVMGKTTEETCNLLDKNPKLKKLITDMSEEDARKFMAILSDRESVARLMATPQAKTLMEGMGKKGKQ